MSQTEQVHSLQAVDQACVHTLIYDQPAIRSPGLPFNGLRHHNPCNYMDYYSFTDPKGMGGWVGLVGWPTADTLPTKWSHVNYRSGI